MARPPRITPDMLIWAYQHGMFPMARSRDEPVDWFTANPRAVMPLDSFHVPHSLRKRIRSGAFVVTRDQAFEQVIRACAEPRAYEANTWINQQIIESFAALHRRGTAHSVEAWTQAGDGGGREMAGGLYGVALGGAFFGESMFSRRTDASKVCLVHLVEHLKSRGFKLLDVQFRNPHLEQFGIEEIDHEQYMQRLGEAMAMPVAW